MAMRYDEELLRIDTVNDLIAKAEELYRQGYVTGPDAENNAVALLREALRLDPDNSDGLRLLSVSATRLADAAREPTPSACATKLFSISTWPSP